MENHELCAFLSYPALLELALKHKEKAVAILPSMAIYPQRLFCPELFVIGQS